MSSRPDPAAVALAGLRGDPAAARAALDDDEPRTRAVALGALARAGALDGPTLGRALRDPDGTVRRRAAEEAGRTGQAGTALRSALADPDPGVVEAAAWALGELDPPTPGSVADLGAVVTGHDDPLCREAAVAALGAIGDDAGLGAVLHATGDKPAVRRRAVIALAAFEGPEVDAALRRALEDRDRQVRQAAEDLLGDA